MRAAEEAIFESVNIHLEEFCGCCYTPFGEALEKAEIISEKISTQEDSIIDRFNTQGKEKGYFVEWNIETQPKPKRVGLNVKLNLTRRRQFCADNGTYEIFFLIASTYDVKQQILQQACGVDLETASRAAFNSSSLLALS